MKLDDLDHKIIEIMQKDARMTNAEIAEIVGSNGPTVRRRIERLVKEDVVKIVAVANPRKMGYKVLAVIAIQIEHTALPELEKAMLALPQVHFCGIMLGGFNVLIEVWLQSHEELLTFLHEELGRIPGIQRVEAQQALKMVKYTNDWAA